MQGTAPAHLAGTALLASPFRQAGEKPLPFSEATGKDHPFQPHSPSPGALFQEFKEEMETVYKIYCASYEHALLLVESYRKDPRLQEEILETLNATV